MIDGARSWKGPTPRAHGHLLIPERDTKYRVLGRTTLQSAKDGVHVGSTFTQGHFFPVIADTIP